MGQERERLRNGQERSQLDLQLCARRGKSRNYLDLLEGIAQKRGIMQIEKQSKRAGTLNMGKSRFVIG